MKGEMKLPYLIRRDWDPKGKIEATVLCGKGRGMLTRDMKAWLKRDVVRVMCLINVAVLCVMPAPHSLLSTLLVKICINVFGDRFLNLFFIAMIYEMAAWGTEWGQADPRMQCYIQGHILLVLYCKLHKDGYYICFPLCCTCTIEKNYWTHGRYAIYSSECVRIIFHSVSRGNSDHVTHALQSSKASSSMFRPLLWAS